MSVINLFEYRNAERIEADAAELEAFLDDVWKRRERSAWYGEVPQEPEADETQQFVQFLRRNGDVQVKSKKYVGVVQFAGHTINLLPKIFFHERHAIGDDAAHVSAMHLHILWWLSYCGRIKFPNYRSAMGATDGSFLEVLMYIYARYTRDLLGSSVFQQYQEHSSETLHARGRLNTDTYLRENISTGRWHKLHCTYDHFDIDNDMNRIIKYVSGLLITATQNAETKRYLQEILFILDEVTDRPATATQCANVKFNPMFGEYDTVRDYCHLFLSGAVSIDYNNDLKLFAFLLPMEVIFEDFIAGFMRREVVNGPRAESAGVTVRTQSDALYLDESQSFALRPDLVIRSGGHTCIADTKYKMVSAESGSASAKVSQADLYQVLAYAVRYGVDDVALVYPNSVMFPATECSHMVIVDALAGNRPVNVRLLQVPVVSTDVLHGNILGGTIDARFAQLREELRAVLEREFVNGAEAVQ
jgi:5-methylcytosine-specific restriction enzyme subunit McrC